MPKVCVVRTQVSSSSPLSLTQPPQLFGKRCTDLSWFSFPSRSDHLLLRFQSAQHISTGENVAIKCMKSSYTSTDEVAKLREIQVEDCSPRFDYFLRVLTFAVTQAIKKLSPHPSIVKLHEVLFDPPSGRLALVFESVRFIPYRGLSLNTYSVLLFSLSNERLMEGNLYELMKDRKQRFSNEQVKSYMQQIYEALSHMHTKVRDQGCVKVTVENHSSHLGC